MSSENIFTILQRNDLSCDGLNYVLFEEFSKTIEDEKEIVKKIIEYNNYQENGKNKYSDRIMQALRQRQGLNKFDFSEDEKLNNLSANEVFEHVVKWNGLLGQYSTLIKSWINEIYGINLDEINL